MSALHQNIKRLLMRMEVLYSFGNLDVNKCRFFGEISKFWLYWDIDDFGVEYYASQYLALHLGLVEVTELGRVRCLVKQSLHRGGVAV